MTSLADLRAQFPQYGEVSDGDFLFALRNKFYPEVHPRTFFDSVSGSTNAHATIKRFRDEYKEAVKAPLPGESEAGTAKRLGGSLDAPVGNPGGPFAVATRSGLQGLTFGAGDEIVARGASLLGGGTYEEELQRERERLEMGREQRPVLATSSEVVGALAVPGAIVKGAKAAPVTTAAKSAGLAAGGGALYGFNAGEGDGRLNNAVQTAAISGALGAAAPSVGGLLERMANSRAAKKTSKALAKAAPSLDDLRAQAGRAFKRADTVGLPSQGLPQATTDIAQSIQARPLNPSITPRAAGVMGDLEDLATTPSATVPFGVLQDLRRNAGAARADFTNPSDQRAGAIIQEGIDAFVAGADPKLSAEIAEARKMWGNLRKTEAIDEIIEKATNQASGFENGLRIGLRQILNSKKKRAGYSKDELDAMRQIVQGTPFGNVMKKLGRLSFGSGQQTNVLSGVLGAGTAGGLGTALTGNPLIGGALAVGTPILGAGAKRASEKTTQKAVDALRGMVATGGQAAPQITATQRGLLDALARSSARTAHPLGLFDTIGMQQTGAAR